MGLISWIKNKYYDHKLKQADKNVAAGDIENAQLAYDKLLGKQPWAPIHLAQLLTDNSPGVNEKLDALKRILELRQYVLTETEAEFTNVLDTHVSNIESLASQCFSKELYNDSVVLLLAIKDFRRTNTFEDKVNRYKAYSAFVVSQKLALNKELFSDTVKYLKAISRLNETDLRHFSETLAKEHKYARAINLLLQFLNVGNWVTKSILEYSVEIVSGKDSDIKKPKKISEFCGNGEICIACAKYIAECANKKAKSRDYKNAVLYDTFASDYLSENNLFNFDRCKHILEELAERADSSEITELNRLAARLKLTDEQQQFIEKRVYDVAKNAIPPKAIAICKLYIVDHKFANLYITKCIEALKCGDKVDITELRSVIGKESDDSTLPDLLSPFIPYIPSYEKDFLDSALKKIKDNASTELLSKYWLILPSPVLISGTVNKSFAESRNFAIYISQHVNQFLRHNYFRDSYCEAVKSLGDVDFTLSTLELLIGKGQDVKDFYVTQVVDLSKSQTNTQNALLIVNRGLENVESDKLMTIKKRLISDLIKEGQLELAETEIKSIFNKDSEAPTLLAELYWERANLTKDNHEKVEWLIRLLEVSEKNALLQRSQNLIALTLAELSVIAKSGFKSNNKEFAYTIATRIKAYPIYWIPLYIWIRNNERDKAETLNQAIKYDVETLNEINATCLAPKEYNLEDLNNLWKDYAGNVIKKAKAQPFDKAIDSLKALRVFEKNSCPTCIEDNLFEECSTILVKIEWSRAIELEQESDYSSAINLYDEIAIDNVSSFVNRAELRSLICHIKSGAVNREDEGRITKALDMRSYQSLREDLAYRYACYLLQVTRPADAEHIIRTYLPDEKQILSLCENVYIKEAEKNLEIFNSLIKKINEGKMLLQDAIEFKQNIQGYKKKIVGKLTDLSRLFGGYTPKIESYILRKMFENEAYFELLTKLMSENPNYIENDVDFRNITIASLGILETDINDVSVLKRAIATCLTAIYSDRLFVQSLEQTSWDDKFTFTLDGSLGQTSYDDYEDLPDNVNFDDPIENVNIAISDVQNSLLTRVETVVRKKHPDLESFLAEEKRALDKIIELNLDKEYILASPHLCRTLSSIRMSIENSFEYELNQNYGNREDVIALGVDYGFHGGEYDEYRKAYNSLSFCKSAVSTKPATSTASTFTVDKVNLIKQYDRLYSDLKSAVATAMNNDIKSDMDYRRFLDKYEVVCKAINDTSLSLTCANYVNGEVVHLLNEDTIELRDGVGYMVRIFNISPSNVQVKQNLEGILRNLVMKVEDGGLSSDKTALDQAIANTGNRFKSLVEDAQIQAKLSVLIDKVNGNKIRKHTALSETYKLYLKAKDNERVCENLVTMCEMCIFEYVIKDAANKSSVTNTLDSLQSNMSATFRRCATRLSNSFWEVWNNLDADTQCLLTNGFALGNPGASLSSKGYCLKSGLRYLRDLGNVRKRNSIGGIHSILDTFSDISKL